MENIKRWYNRNYNQITWFLIGFMVMAGCSDLGNHDYTAALISFGIAFVNYLFVKRS